MLDGTQQIFVERETERDIEKKKGRNEGRKKERKEKRTEVKLLYFLLWCFGSPVWGGLSLHARWNLNPDGRGLLTLIGKNL